MTQLQAQTSPRYVQRLAVAFTILVALTTARACANDETFQAAPSEVDDLGQVCAYHEDCVHFCKLGLQGMAPYCTRVCDSDAACPGGYVCVSDGQMGRVCSIGYCDALTTCPEGFDCDSDRDICIRQGSSCTVDDDCPAATACNQGVCEPICHSDDDCKQGFLCHHDSRCVECVSTTDCDGTFACVDGHCNTACIEDRDCRIGFGCVGAACEEIVGGGPGVLGDGCAEHGDCANFCYHDGRCNMTCDPADPQSCPEGWACHEGHGVCSEQG